MERDGVTIPFTPAAPVVVATPSAKNGKTVRRADPEDGFLNWLLGKPLTN
jgi:hypothetical protein